MSVKIDFAVPDSRSLPSDCGYGFPQPRDGRFIENIGFYDPVTKTKN